MHHVSHAGWAWVTEAIGEEPLLHQSMGQWLWRSKALWNPLWIPLDGRWLRTSDPGRSWKSVRILKSDVPWCADLPNGRPGKQGQTLNFNYLNYYANPQIVSRTGKMGNSGMESRRMVYEFWERHRMDFLPGFSTFDGEINRNHIISSMLNTEVTMPHTVQAYSLLDPAPTYGNSNFSDLGAWAAQADGNCRTHGLDIQRWALKIHIWFDHARNIC